MDGGYYITEGPNKMVIKINLVLVAIAIFMLGVMPSVYAHTPYYMKGYKLGMEDGKTGGGGYGLLLPFIFVLFYKLVAKGVCHA
jgi:hypothetical protein